MKCLSFSEFNKYKRVAIFSTSNSLLSRGGNIGLIYYSVKVVKVQIEEAAPKCIVDMIDSKDDETLCVKCFDSISKNDYDAVVMMNHTADFFAGTLPRAFYMTMMMLDNYDGDVWWCYDTPAYFPQKTHVQIIQQYGKYQYKKWNKLLIEKSLSDNAFNDSLNAVDDRMKLISDIDVELIPDDLVNASDLSKCFYDRICKTSYIKSNCAKMIGTMCQSKNDFSQKKHDVCIAFNYDAYRFSLAKKYIDDDSLDVASVRHELDSKLRCKTTLVPRINDILKYYDFLERDCYSSLIVTTREHLNCLIPERFYGVFNSYTIGFIPVECNPSKSWIKSEELKKFSYVESKDELVSKVKMLKSSKSFYDSIIKMQREEIA